MRFSDRFNNALDSVGNADYRPPPKPLRDGLHVSVFADGAHAVFVCYGVIIESEWNAWTGDYVYEMQVCHSQQTIRGYGQHIVPATPEEMRLGFVKVEGGFPELATKP
jgi:hypothetical protein